MTASLSAVTDRDPLDYMVGDPVRFLFRATGAPPGAIVRWRRLGDDGLMKDGESSLDHDCPRSPMKDSVGRCGSEPSGPGVENADATCEIKVAGPAKPGFLHLRAELFAPGGGEPIAVFTGGAGADVREIRADHPEPPGFDAFWERQRADLAATPMTGATCRSIESGRADVRLFEIAVPCPGGRPCTGLLSVPAAGGPFPARVRLRGYEAGWSEIAWKSPPPGELAADAIVLYLSSHGFAFNREPVYYAALRAQSKSRGFDVGFDPEQNAAPETSYFRGMALRVLRGLEYLKTRPEWNRRDILAYGGSLGGLQAIWAAALDHDVTECRPRIPWGCNMGGPATGRFCGSWRIPWVPALGFYDAANMAPRMPATCRVVVPMAGFGDDISPPSGVMAFFNALSCPKSATFVQGAAHFTVPPEPWSCATA